MWVDSGTGVPIGAEVRLTEKGQLQLIDDEGKVHFAYFPSGNVGQMLAF